MPFLFIRFLPSTTLLPPAETLFHLPSIFWKNSKTFHQQPGKVQRLFSNNPKIFKDFFACRIVLAANSQYPGNIQILSEQSTAATSNSNQQQQPATAINSSNQQQQPAAATSSSNQQQQPATAVSSSNQQQQSIAATSSSNQHQQSAFIVPAAPTQSTPSSVSYHYGS